ncbi:DUF1127 domain-containing protein [Rouxiella sp. WC2420]|uniref:DUF1127 domain-containing protein n=1 Tax=Rouxiella sp. WC2420 TaxID=3234145 RepID=A0AB39VWS3_9GAMM
MKRICESDQFITRVTGVIDAADAEKTVASTGKFTDKYIDNSALKLGWWDRFVIAFAGWRERRQTARILKGLSASQLKDIGLSCHDIDKVYGHRDVSRKIWPHWPK